LDDGLSSIDCAEKYFNFLMISLFYINHNNSNIENIIQKIRNNIDQNKLNYYVKKINEFRNHKTIIENFDKLKNYLNLEGRLDYKLDERLKKSKDYFLNQEYFLAFQEIDRAFKNYRPLNIYELKRLIKEVENAGDLIKGKDIILLLGETGAGKTTVIQFLLGMKMKKKVFFGISHIEGDIEEYINRINKNGPYNQMKSDNIKNLKSSCFLRSETRFINPIQLDLDKDDRYNIDSIIICDTPGFRDTNGTEVDIANGLSIINTINMAKSIRPVILISERNIGDRGGDLKRYANTINSIFPKFSTFSEEINFIFTKFQKDDAQNLLNKINNLYNNLPKKDQLNESLKKFLNILKRKLIAENEPSKSILDPINDNRKEFLDLIFEKEEIKDPKKFFKNFITEESLKDINEQYSIHDNIIQNCLSKHEYEIVDFKLKELIYLNEKTQNQNLINKYNEIFLKVKQHLNNIYENINNQFYNTLRIIDENNIDNIKGIKFLIEMLNKAKILKETIKDDFPNILLLENNIDEQIKYALEYVEKNDFYNIKVNLLVKNLQNVISVFPKYEKQFLDAQKFIATNFSEFEMRIRSLFSDSNKNDSLLFDYLEFKYKLEKLNESVYRYNDIISKEEKEAKVLSIEKLFKEFIDFYEKKGKECIETLEDIEMKKKRKFPKQNKNDLIECSENFENNDLLFEYENYDKLSTISKFLYEINEILILNFDFINKKNDFEKLKELKVKIIYQIHKNLKESLYVIEDFIENQKISNFEMVCNELKNIQILTSIQNASQEFKNLYSSNLENIIDILESKLRIFKKNLYLLSNKVKERINRKNLTDFLDDIDKIRFINELNPSTYFHIIKEINNALHKFIDQHIENMNLYSINLDEIEQLSKMADSYFVLFNIIKLFGKYENIIPQIKNSKTNIENSISSFEDRIKDLLKNIKKYFQDLDNNKKNLFINVTEKSIEKKTEGNNLFDFIYFRKIETGMKFLQSCKINNLLPCEFSNDFNDLEKNIINLLKNIQDFLNKEKDKLILSIFKILKCTKIKNIENEKDDLLNDFISFIKKLIDIIKIFEKIDEHCPIINKLLNPSNEFINQKNKFLEDLYNCFREETNEYPQKKNFFASKFKLNLLKVFTSLGSTMINDDSIKDIFNDLLKNRLNCLEEYLSEFELDLDILLEKKDYETLVKNLSKYSNISGDKNLNKIITNIKNIIKNQIEEHLNVAQELKDFFIRDQSLDEIKKSFNKLKEAYKLIIHYKNIDEKSYNKLNELKKFIYNSYEGVFNKFNDNKIKIEIEQYKQIERIKFMIKEFKTLGDEVFKKSSGKLSEICKLIEKKLEDEFENWKTKKLEEIIETYPKDLFVIIEKLNSKIHLEFIEDFKKKIDLKLNQMENIKDKEEFNNLKQLINKCLNCKFIEKETHDFKERLEEISKDYESEIEENLRNLKNIIKKKDYQELSRITLEYLKNKSTSNKEFLEIIRNFVKNKSQEIKRLFENNTGGLNQFENFFDVFKDISELIQLDKLFDNENCLEINIEKFLKNYVAEINKIKKENKDLNKLLYFDEYTLQAEENLNNKQLIKIQISKDSFNNKYEINDHRNLFENVIVKDNVDNYRLKNDTKDKIKNFKIKLFSIIDSIIKGYKFMKPIKFHLKEKEENSLSENKNNILDNFIINFKNSSKELIEDITKDFYKNIQSFFYFSKNSDADSLFLILLKFYTIDNSFKKIYDNLSLFNYLNEYYYNQDESEINLSYEDYANNLHEISRKIYNDFNRSGLFKFEKNIDINHNSFITELINKIKFLQKSSLFNCLIDFPKNKTDLFSQTILVLEKEFGNMKNHFIDLIQNLDFKINYDEEIFILSFQKILIKFNEVNKNSSKNINMYLEDISQIVNETFEKKINYIRRSGFKIISEDEISKQLICLKILSTCINDISSEKRFSEFIIELKDNTSRKFLFKVGLNLDKYSIGKRIIKEDKIFNIFENQFYDSKIKCQDEKYVLKGLKIEKNNKIIEDNKENLTEIYNKFNEFYEKIINRFLRDSILGKFDDLIYELKYKFVQVDFYDELREEFRWKSNRAKIPELLAYIFSLWTLKKSFTSNDEFDQEDINLLKPNALQIISIFTILDLSGNENLKNHLAEIKSGDGKSLIIGVLSILFALLGVNVYIACNNSYLSKRDYKYFADIFDSLGISNNIKYNTLKNICEDFLNKKFDNFSFMESYIRNQNLYFNEKKEINIILIDEIDQLLSKDFYGNYYIPCFNLKDPIISKLLDFIWTERNNTNLNLNVIINSKEYKDCLGKFYNFKALFEGCAYNVLCDLKNFKTFKYELEGSKINGDPFHNSFGYKQMFAYYNEFTNRKIEASTMENQKGFIVKCAKFLYTDIFELFTYKFGVTTNLECLSYEEGKIINEICRFYNKSYFPSAYEGSKLKFDKDMDVNIYRSSDFYQVIVDQIIKKIEENPERKMKSVLIFFENNTNLKEFSDSKEFEYIKNNFKKIFIFEDNNSKFYDDKIREATNSGCISLLTKRFGQGIDFTCKDEDVINQGGVHVIQTYLSESNSEQIKIQGRTARRGQMGSYEMILLIDDLPKFGINYQGESINISESINIFKKFGCWFGEILRIISSSNEAEKKKNNKDIKNESIKPFRDITYDILYEYREKISNYYYMSINQSIQDLKINYLRLEDFSINLEKFNKFDINEYLNKINNFIKFEDSAKQVYRTIILLEASPLMNSFLENFAEKLDLIIFKLMNIINQNNLNILLEFQLVLYQDYNNPCEMIIKISDWESNSDYLKQFLKGRKIKGGKYWNYATELGLLHVKNESKNNKISQVILIGKKESNSKEFVKYKKENYFGEKYWNKTIYAENNDYINESKELKKLNIPVNSIYLSVLAKSSFEEISKFTNGVCKEYLYYNIDKEKFVNIIINEFFIKDFTEILNKRKIIK